MRLGSRRRSGACESPSASHCARGQFECARPSHTDAAHEGTRLLRRQTFRLEKLMGVFMSFTPEALQESPTRTASFNFFRKDLHGTLGAL